MRRGSGASSQAKQAASQQPRETAGGGEGLGRPVDFGSDALRFFFFFLFSFLRCLHSSGPVTRPACSVKALPPTTPSHKDRQTGPPPHHHHSTPPGRFPLPGVAIVRPVLCFFLFLTFMLCLTCVSQVLVKWENTVLHL